MTQEFNVYLKTNIRAASHIFEIPFLHMTTFECELEDNPVMVNFTGQLDYVTMPSCLVKR